MSRLMKLGGADMVSPITGPPKPEEARLCSAYLRECGEALGSAARPAALSARL